MMKKIMAGIVTAGALSVPLAGVAWADQPSNPGSNGNHGANSNQGGNGADHGQAGDHGNGNPGSNQGVGQGNGNGGTSNWGPGDAPGHNPFGAPGQVSQDPTLDNGAPNPFFGVPPGQWGDPAQTGLPATWTPPNGTEALPLVWNPAQGTFGVWVNDNEFVPFTPEPAPTP
jgi:hypothetical protein